MHLTMDESGLQRKSRRSSMPATKLHPHQHQQLQVQHKQPEQQQQQQQHTYLRPSTPPKAAPNAASSPRQSSPFRKKSNTSSRPSSPSPSKRSPAPNVSPTSPLTPTRQVPHLPTPSPQFPIAAITSHSKHRRLSLDATAHSSWKNSSSSSTSSSTSPSLFYSTIGPKRSSVQAPLFFLPSSPSTNSLADLANSFRRSSQGDVALESDSKDEEDDNNRVLEKLRASRRRASQADIMLRASQVDLLMQKSEKKNSLPNLKAKHIKGHKGVDGKKECYVLVLLDDQETVVLTCRDEQHLKSILTAALMDRRVHSYRLVVASTRAVLKVDQGISRRVRSCEDLLESTDLSGLDDFNREGELSDERLLLTTEFLDQERLYCDKLQSLFEYYAEPLRKFSSLSKEDHQVMFVPIEPLFSISASLLAKLEAVLETWDTDTSRLGNLFSTKFWNYYQEYLSTYATAKRLLTEKYRTDPAFEEFCELRQGQGRLSLDALLSLPESLWCGP